MLPLRRRRELAERGERVRRLHQMRCVLAELGPPTRDLGVLPLRG
jgi:hypothetical protein